MQWAVYGMLIGLMALLAWYRAREQQQKMEQDRLFGFLALAALFLVLVLASTLL